MSFYYLFSKLFTYLVLPPGIFIFSFLLASFYAKRFKSLFFLLSLSFYALSTPYVAKLLLQPLEKPFNTKVQETSVNGIIVLGGGHIPDSSNIPLSSSAYKRALWGLMLAKQLDKPLLFSGAGLYDYSESDAFLDSMKEIEKSLHVKIFSPNSLELKGFSVYVEDKSLNTYENAKYSKEFFERRGLTNPRVYLVTSAFHMKRSIKIYEHFGFEVISAATDFRTSSQEPTFGWLPNMGSLSASYTAIHEYVGILSLVLKGIY